MKKFAIIMLLAFCSLVTPVSSAIAAEDYNIESEIDELMGFDENVDINGTIKHKGNTDYHLIPAAQTGSIGGAVSAAVVAASAMALRVNTVNGPVFDPYMIKIDGTTYVFVKENNDGVWDNKDILGFYDKPDDLFESLRTLASTNPQKVTPSDLKRNGVRLVPLLDDGKLYVKDNSKDFDVEKISYIDISKSRKLANSSNVGVFGHFKIKMEDGRMLTGYVTYNSDAKLQNLF